MRSAPSPMLATLLVAALAAVGACAPVAGAPVSSDLPLEDVVAPAAKAASLAPVATEPPGGSSSSGPVIARPVIAGSLRYFGAPLADAAVTARIFGQREVLASTTARPDGSFALALPAGVSTGALVQVTAASGGRALANVTRVPARQVFQVDAEDLLLDPASTLALMVLAPRLLAAIALGSDDAKRTALASLAEATEALGGENASVLLNPASFDAAVAAVLDAAGQVMQTTEAREAVARAVPEEAVAALTTLAEALSDLIRTGIEAGLPRPDDALLGPLAIGTQDLDAIGSSGAEPEDEATITGGLTIEAPAGVYASPVGPVTAVTR